MVSAADTPNIDSAGAVAEFITACPAIITKVGVMVTTAVNPDNSVALTATLSRRPVLTSSSNAVTLGTFTIMAANATNLAVGAVRFKRLHIDDADGETAEDGTLRNEAPSSNITAAETGMNPWIILPGQSFALTLDTNAEADSGAVISFIEYIELPWNGNFVDQTLITEDTSNSV
jgi:hypothetical protein